MGTLKYINISSVILFFIVAVFALASIYSFPQTDDFCTFGRILSKDRNPISESFFLYHNWTGRYSAGVLMSLPAWISTITPISLHDIYRFFIFLYIIAFPASVFYYIKTISSSNSIATYLSLLLSGFVFLITTSKVEALYWLTGSAIYFISLTAFFLVAVQILRDLNSKNHTLPSLPLLLLIIFAVGTNELIAISVGTTVFLFCIFTKNQSYPISKKIALLVVFIAAFLITVLAPGNFVRDTKDPSFIIENKHNIIAAARLGWISLETMWRYNVLGNPGVVFFGILSSILIGILSAHRKIYFFSRSQTLIMASAIVSIPMQFFVYSFLTGDSSPGRIINQAAGLFWPSLAILISSLANQVSNRLSTLGTAAHFQSRKITAIALLISTALFLPNQEFKRLNQSITNFAPHWAHEQVQRDSYIRKASLSGTTTIEVPRFSPETSKPNIFQGADITKDRKNWINQCVANYYKVPEIILSSTP